MTGMTRHHATQTCPTSTLISTRYAHQITPQTINNSGKFHRSYRTLFTLAKTKTKAKARIETASSPLIQTQFIKSKGRSLSRSLIFTDKTRILCIKIELRPTKTSSDPKKIRAIHSILQLIFNNRHHPPKQNRMSKEE